jgi:glycopeptide antibiotics resistance protein
VPHFLYPFLPYRSFAGPILVAWAISVPCWLIVRWYRRRTLAQRPSMQREILLLIAVLYLSALAAVTLIPSRPSRAVAATTVDVQLHPSIASLTCTSASLRSGTTAHSFCVRNARGNFLLFIPLGVLLPLVWRRLRFWRGALIALALSIGIELLQYLSIALGSHRTADVNDVILNTVGACAGLALVSLLRLWSRGPDAGALNPPRRTTS